MSRFKNKIITASAGTGKTYRLSVEYIRILLNHLDKYHDFNLDSILVLTFTKKATAEIRERINIHLALLCDPNPSEEKDQKERRGLLESLYEDGESKELSDKQMETLNKALRQISFDRKQLQVMTIDSYISSIFRNIVRPLRSIESYEIDNQAVEKRLPFLMDHLMSEKHKPLLDKLLRRKVSPSLDEYQNFFSTLIKARWLHFLIQKLDHEPAEGTLLHLAQNPDSALRDSDLENARQALMQILQLLQETDWSDSKVKKPKDLFKKAFCDMLGDSIEEWDDIVTASNEMLSIEDSCHKFFTNNKNGAITDGRKLTAKKLTDLKDQIKDLEASLAKSLANYLIHTHFLKEQEEILEVWTAVLKEYDKLIYRYKNMTYNDVSWFTLEALFSTTPPNFDMQTENVATEFYQFLSHRSRFILIDEFQDTSLMQFAILQPIIEEVISGPGTKDFGGVIIVGDEKQSIFGWRGGERDLLLNLHEIFPGLRDAKTDPLDKSWRSSNLMVEFINQVFDHIGNSGILERQNLKWDYPKLREGMEKLDPQTRIEFQTSAYSYQNEESSKHSIHREFVKKTILPTVDENPKKSMALLCRTGKELENLQKLLDEYGITSIYQPSSILPEHAWVSPLIAWLRWLAFRNWLDLLELMRSNYFMLDAPGLKKAVDEIYLALQEQREPDFSNCLLAQELIQLSETADESIHANCRAFLEYALPPLLKCEKMQPKERDFLNIHAFLAMARDFELNQASGNCSIPAFLDYLDDNLQQDSMKQVSVEGEGALELLTIHKSKGLQFDHVFFFYDLSASAGKDYGHFQHFEDYATQDFQSLHDYALTYHYDKILEQSDYGNLVQTSKNRMKLEELNTFYVGLTRAKTALHVCLAYRGDKGFDKYCEEKTTDTGFRLPALVGSAILKFFQNKEIAPDETGKYIWLGSGGTAEPDEKKEKTEEGISLDQLAAALPAKTEKPAFDPKPDESHRHMDWKKVWLEDRSNLFGDLAHHYLSFLKKGSPEEHDHAFKQCLTRFGAIIPLEELRTKLNSLKNNLSQDQIFPAGYDKVFTEFTVWHNGFEQRLDRLVLDTKNKKALILDYKTGKEQDARQLERYKQALQALDALKDYQIDTKFIELKI